MTFLDWLEFRNEVWLYLNGMITIILRVTHLDKWIYSVIRKIMGI